MKFGLQNVKFGFKRITIINAKSFIIIQRGKGFRSVNQNILETILIKNQVKLTKIRVLNRKIKNKNQKVNHFIDKKKT